MIATRGFDNAEGGRRTPLRADSIQMTFYHGWTRMDTDENAEVPDRIWLTERCVHLKEGFYANFANHHELNWRQFAQFA
jgi:hypothetical protein